MHFSLTRLFLFFHFSFSCQKTETGSQDFVDSENSLPEKPLSRLSCNWLLLFILNIPAVSFAQNCSGIITETDTLRPVPFAFVVNKRSGNGSVADAEGKFSIQANSEDSLVFSALGYLPRKVKSSEAKGRCVRLFPSVTALPDVVISSQRMSVNERRYIERFINVPKPDFSSPVSALYEQFSREGKSREKLRQLYEKKLYLEDFKERCMPFFRHRKINLVDFDVEEFCYYCKLSPDFIRTSDSYTFFFAISRCFDSYTGKVSEP